MTFRSHFSKCLALLLGIAVVWLSAPALTRTASGDQPANDKEAKAFFEKQIQPILVKECYECHSTKRGKQEGGLAVDSRKAIRRGGDRGPAIVPNDVDASLLLGAIGYDDEDLQMPPDGKLPDAVIANFKKWVEDGAVDPRD
ncbi:MAG: hypothetical protein KDB14_01785 [Planctomycetales bacterium]|nr:hypothetical protein [Planctomycetales bacterium]